MPDEFEQLGGTYADAPAAAGDDFQKLGGTYEAPQPSLLSRIAGSDVIQHSTGLGESISKGVAHILPSPRQIVTYLPGVAELGQFLPAKARAVIARHLPDQWAVHQESPSSRTPAYYRGAKVGDVVKAAAPYMLGGEGLEALRVGGKALPYIGKGLKWLGKEGGPAALKRAIGTGGYNALEDPKHPLHAAVKGALLSGAFDAAGVLKGVKPQTQVDNAMKYLSGGRPYEENTKLLASKIKDAHAARTTAGGTQYRNFLTKAGDTDVSPDTYKAASSVTVPYLRGAKRLHDQFMKDPTIENAHFLQSQLGSDAAKVGKQFPQDVTSMRAHEEWLDARNAIKDDAHKALMKKDPTGKLAAEYQDATDFHRDTVMPYRENKNMAQIALGHEKNPRNISNIFKNSDAGVKVAGDMGDEGKRLILNAEIGKKLNMTPNKLLDADNKLDVDGLAAYRTPEFQKAMGKLYRASLGKAVGKAVVKTGTTVAGIHAGGDVGGTATKVFGGMSGAAIAPALMRALGRSGVRRLASSEPFLKSMAEPLSLIRPLLISNLLKKRGQ